MTPNPMKLKEAIKKLNTVKRIEAAEDDGENRGEEIRCYLVGEDLIIRREVNEMKEKLQFKIAWLIPRWLVYFASIRLVANATQGKHSSQVVPELSAIEALKRW